jgi:hypothetical protein
MVKLADGTNLDGTNKALYGTPYTTGDAVYDTADKDTNQQINVRSDTVYYYVSKATNGGLSVTTYTGYANAPKTSGETVKDIYAVATKTTSNYWVANVVVVELNDFKGAAENVFVYNYPENVNTLKSANIDIIKADGTTTTVTIKKPEGVDYGPAYLYGNETDGYSLVMMKDADIKANNYAIGVVTAAVDLVDTDYAEITDVLNDSNDTTSAYAPYSKSTAAKDAHRLKDNDSASYYEYTISQVTGRTSATKYDKGTLEESTAKAVLTETVTVKKTPKTNLVFASYDNRGNIIYAISFNQDDSDASKTATDVFKGLLKEAESDEHTVTVKTVGINGVDDQTIKVADGEDKTITVAQTGYSLASYTAVITGTSTSVKDSVLELKDGTLVATNVTNNITITLTYSANKHNLTVNNTNTAGTQPSDVKIDGDSASTGTAIELAYAAHTITFTGANATKYTYTIKVGSGAAGAPQDVTMSSDGTSGTITVPATDDDVVVTIINNNKDTVGYTITKTCSEDKTAEPTVTVSNESTSNNVYKGDDVKFSITGVNAKDQVVSVSYSVGGGDPVALTDTLVITVVTRAREHKVTLTDSSSTNLTVDGKNTVPEYVTVADATGTITIVGKNPIKITGFDGKCEFERTDDAKTWTIKNVTDAVELEIANAD